MQYGSNRRKFFYKHLGCQRGSQCLSVFQWGLRQESKALGFQEKHTHGTKASRHQVCSKSSKSALRVPRGEASSELRCTEVTRCEQPREESGRRRSHCISLFLVTVTSTDMLLRKGNPLLCWISDASNK